MYTGKIIIQKFQLPEMPLLLTIYILIISYPLIKICNKKFKILFGNK